MNPFRIISGLTLVAVASSTPVSFADGLHHHHDDFRRPIYRMSVSEYRIAARTFAREARELSYDVHAARSTYAIRDAADRLRSEATEFERRVSYASSTTLSRLIRGDYYVPYYDTHHQTGSAHRHPVTRPPVVRPPVVRPPVVRPPVVRPPVVRPPVRRPPIVRPPIVRPPIVRPPIVRPPIVRPPRYDYTVSELRSQLRRIQSSITTLSRYMSDRFVDSRVRRQFSVVRAEFSRLDLRGNVVTPRKYRSAGTMDGLRFNFVGRSRSDIEARCLDFTRLHRIYDVRSLRVEGRSYSGFRSDNAACDLVGRHARTF